MSGRLFPDGIGAYSWRLVKIALVILHADPARGGAERYTADLAAALRARGQEVSVLASSFPGGRVPEGDVLLAARGATRAGRYARFLDELTLQLARADYDIVHAMLPVPRCDIYHPHAGIAAEAVASGHLKHRGRIRRALSRAGTRLNRRRQRFASVERELLTSSSPPVVLCLSEYVKGFVRRHYSLPPSNLVTLLNGVDLDRFDPAARPQAGEEIRRRFGLGPEKVIGLMIAQDFSRKGLRESILAMARLADPRLVLLVVGKQDPRAYQELARRAGVERVIFAGPANDPYAFYRAADFFLLPTRHDPCSLVVLEALAMGVPVISTVFNGACELMTSGTHGFVLPDPADMDALAEALRNLLDSEARAGMSAACLQFRRSLAHGQHVDRLMQIYQAAR